MSTHGILIISHGSRDLKWVEQVDHTIANASSLFYSERSVALSITIEEAQQQYPIVSSFLELVDGRLIQDGINSLQNKGVTHITVLPLFVSAGSTHVEEIKQAFGFTPATQFIGDLPPLSCNCTVTFDLPLIDDEEIIHIICRQLNSFAVMRLEKPALLLIGHGSTEQVYFNIWEQGMNAILEKLKRYYPALPMSYAALLPDQSKKKINDLTTEYTNVIVIPLFISKGYFTSTVIPSRLEGFNYIYSGETLLPSQEMVKLLIRRFKAIYKRL